MKLQDFRLGWRHLIQQPAYSLVVVMGLAIGIAACLLLLGFVRYSLTYNAQVPDAKNVYVLKQRFNVDPRTPWFEIGPLGLVGVARNNEVVADATGFWQDDSHMVRIGDTLKKANIVFAGPHFADMLGIHAIAGDLHSALEQPNGVALTEDTAQRWFGNTPAVGKSVQLDDHLMSIAAVVPNPPANSTMPYETLAGWNSELVSESSKKGLLGMEGIWGKVLLKLKPGSSPAALTEALQQAVDHSPLAAMMPPERSRELGGRSAMDLRLTPLMDTYFDQDVAGAPFSGPRGDLKMVLGLAAVALLILGLAVINYVNLAVIRILRRQREIAIRKLLGASVRQVVQQLLAESMLVSLLATTMGLLLAWLVLPTCSELLDRNLEGLFSIGNIGFCLALALVIGIVSGIQPAWVAVRVPPAQALAGRSNAESSVGARLRWCLTTLQFATAAALAGVTLVIAYQSHYAGNANPGFDVTSLLVVDSHSIAEADGRAFRDSLARLPGVAGVAASSEAVGRHTTLNLVGLARPGGQNINMQSKSVSPNFFEVYQVHPFAGRLYNAHQDAGPDAPVIVLNQAAAFELGFPNPQAAVGQKLNAKNDQDGTSRQFEIVGIAPDIRHESLHEAPVGTAYLLADNLTVLTLRVQQGMPEVEHAVDTLWHQAFPQEELEMHRAGSFFALEYAEDARLAKLLSASTCLALLIAGFGIYALSAYNVRRKEREIVLRKLYGARRRHIAALVLRDSLIVIAAGTSLGIPFALVGAQRYLAGFVEHAPFATWGVALAALGAASLVLIGAARQTLVALRLAPAIAFRNE